MAAGDIHVADLLDTEMDSVVRSHHLNKPVWSPVIGEQFVLEKEPASQFTQWICSGSDKEFSDSGCIPSEKNIHRSHGIL